MDVRYTTEQQALRDSAAQVVRRLGLQSVGQLDDAERTTKLDAAVSAAGWRELRTASDGSGAWASAVEVSIVAEEMGRGLADTAFIGPTLAADLRRLAGAAEAVDPETVALVPNLTRLAGPVEGGVAIDSADAVSALVVGPDGVVSVVALDGTPGGVDLTRPGRPAAGSAQVLGIVGPDQLLQWSALALAVTTADLVGVMQGALDLTVDYAKGRRQYGVPIGSFQAVAHMLADSVVHLEGSRTALLHAAWAVDALAPGEALAATASAKAYASRAAREVCEIAVQVHGGIGNTWECLAHVYLRRAMLSTDVLGGIGHNLDRVLAHAAGREIEVDFRDSPEEAAFRARLREWLVDNNPHLPPSSTSDEYWERQPDWHRSLHRAGFFGLTWPTEHGGHGMPSAYDVIVDEELSRAGAPPRPSLGYLVHAVLHHANDDVKQRFLPGLISGVDRWCQGFSEPDAGSDLASLRTRAELVGDEYVITGHKVWTSYSDSADWCFLLARTDSDVPKHKGISAFAIRMDQPGIEQRPLRMMNGITREFGEVSFDGARAAAENMIGEPGEGWRVAMTVLSHEREPQELGNASRYTKTAKALTGMINAEPDAYTAEQRRDLAWAIVESDMLQHLVSRRLSDRLDGIQHGPDGSIDKLLNTWVEQAVGRAAVHIAGAAHDGGDPSMLSLYLYSRAQSVMGGTSQIQKNLIAERILGLPTS